MEDIVCIGRGLRRGRIGRPEQGHYVEVALEGRMDRVQEQRFIRIHKSYIVNFDHISEFCRQSIVLRDGTQLPVSRTYRAAVSERIHQLLKEAGVKLDEEKQDEESAA